MKLIHTAEEGSQVVNQVQSSKNVCKMKAISIPLSLIHNPDMSLGMSLAFLAAYFTFLPHSTHHITQ